MFEAAKNGNLEAAQTLLKNGADINQLNHLGMSPLTVATIYQQSGFVQMLLEKGARPDIKDQQEYTALDYAVERNVPGVFQVLLSHFAKKEAHNEGELQLLEALAQKKPAEIARLLKGKKRPT